MRGSVKLSLERRPTARELAEAFCDLNDEDQAQVLIEAAKIASEWPTNNGMQWFYVGRHLKNCECSTEEARDLVRDIAHGLE